MLQNGTEIVPVQDKGGEDTSGWSFSGTLLSTNRNIPSPFSKRSNRQDGNIANIPPYLAGKTRVLV